MRIHTVFLRPGRFAKAALCLLLVFVMLSQTAVVAFGEDEETIYSASGVENRPPAVDPTGLTDGYSAILYNNTNGLPTSEANAIAETEEGFLWIGSYAGLIRYDGNTFDRVDSTNGITSVMCLYVDSDNRLWIGTNANGVAVMERGEYRIWGLEDGLKTASVRALTQDTGGVIYVGTTMGIALIDRDMNLTMLDDERLSEQYIREIRIGTDGLIYGLTLAGDLFTLKDGKVIDFISYSDCNVSGIISIYPDPMNPGFLYLGAESSTVFYGNLEHNFTVTKTENVAPLTYVERFEYIDGRIWICAGDGIGNLGPDGFRQLDNVPMNNSVSHVMTDYSGNLWFVSTRQGVMKVVPNQFTDIYENCGLPDAVVNSTCLYGDQLFVATDSGLTVIENGKALESLPLTKATRASGLVLDATDLLDYLSGVRIRSIIRDSQGRLWISTWRKHGLIRYDKGEITVFNVFDDLLSDRMRVVYELSDGRMAVANTGGVSIIENDRVVKNYGEEDGIVNTEILTVTEGMNGDLLLGSDGGGIYIIGKDGTRHLGVEDGLSAEVIMRIKRDATRDIFWIVTTNSIAYMDADYKVTTVRKFPYPNNFDLYQNSVDDLWIMAGNGIYVVPAENMLANEDINPVFYNYENGLPCVSTANSYCDLSAEGDLYIAGTSGVAKVNIEQPFENVNDLKAAVPFIEVDGATLYPGLDGTFTIPAQTQKLTVPGFVFSYSLSNPQVSYQLEGFDRSSTTVSRSDLVPVDYTNLRGGTYHFIMQLHDALGRGNKVISVEITKEKKLYEKTWFIVLALALMLVALEESVRLYVRKRMKKLEKKHRETMTLISEITEAFAKVIDMKDKYTNGHSSRVAKYTTMLAKELGYDDETVEKYYRIALLHDIGKIGVPPEVLNKPGKLTDDEFHTIQSHTSQGYEALKEISIMPELAIGAQAHHERPDGRGYPNHLKGEEIPRVAQIIAVADCFDAMYSNRPYRNRMNFDKVVSIIRSVSGTQLTEDVVDAFLRLVDRGEFRDPDDQGGGSTENIENIRSSGEKSGS